MRAENIATILTILEEREKTAKLAVDTLVELARTNNQKDVTLYDEVKPDTQYFKLWLSRTEDLKKVSRAYSDFLAQDWR